MRRSFCRKASALVYIALAVAGDRNLSGQSRALTVSPFEIGAGVHETRAQWQNSLQLPNASEVPPDNEIIPPPPPTRSSFMATWPKLSGARGYLLDVSTSRAFDSFVEGLQALDVGDATGRVVTGLRRGTTYYYRVRPYDATGAGRYSATFAATTEATAGLVIHPTFDSSITGNPNSAAIQATINAAIAIDESLFTDPITIEIRFRYSTTEPNGDPLPAGLIAQSNFVVYTIPWSTYINALRAGQGRRYLRISCQPVRPGGRLVWIRRRRCLQTGPWGPVARTTESLRLIPPPLFSSPGLRAAATSMRSARSNMKWMRSSVWDRI